MNKRIVAWMLVSALLGVPPVWADPMGEDPGPVESVMSPDNGEAAQEEVANRAIAIAFVPRSVPEDGPLPPVPVPEDVNGIPLDAILAAQELEDALNAEFDALNAEREDTIPIDDVFTPEDPVPDPRFTLPEPVVSQAPAVPAVAAVAAVSSPVAPPADPPPPPVPPPTPNGGLLGTPILLGAPGPHHPGPPPKDPRPPRKERLRYTQEQIEIMIRNELYGDGQIY